MAHGSGVRLELEAARLPSLPGARALAAAGQLDRRLPAQPRVARRPVELAPDVPADLVEIAFDPQTSGGLLAAIPAATADAAVAALHAAGVEAATIVGAVRERRDGPWIVLH